jgi:osmoprotectant transport system ATP-binding protein
LAANPPVMLMDEPFGALDPVTRDEITQAYRDIHDRLGLTTVMVTHDIQEALLLSDRVIVMAQGAIIADGTPEEVAALKAPKLVADMINMPRRQARRIQALLERKDVAADE